MITIRLKDGKEKQFESAVSLADAAKAISNSLGKNALVAKVKRRADGSARSDRGWCGSGILHEGGSGRAFHAASHRVPCDGAGDPAPVPWREVCYRTGDR